MVKTKFKDEWIIAPILEEEIEPCLTIMKRLLEFFDFKTIQKDDMVIPKQLLDLGVNDDKYMMPTKSLFTHSSPLFLGVTLTIKYTGSGMFSINFHDEYEEKLIDEISELNYLAHQEYQRTKNYSSINKVLKKYYLKKR